MKERKIEVKNYLIYAGVVILTMVITFYLGRWYQKTENYRKEENVIATVLSEIKPNELDSYLLENPNMIVYISNEKEEAKEYEQTLKKIVVKYNLRDEIIYLNMEDTNEFEKWKQTYYKNGKTVLIPNLFAFENGEVVASLKEGNTELTKQNTIDFLKRHEVLAQ